MTEKNKHSETYLKKTIGKNTGFSIPKDYLSEFDQEIDAKILKDSIGNNEIYKVPEDYFSSFDNKIIAKTSPKVIKLNARQKVMRIIPFAAAACILLFIGINTFVLKNTSNLENLTDQDIEYWLESNTLSSIEIADVLETDLLLENEFTLTNIEDSSIEDFMDNYDTVTILNEN